MADTINEPHLREWIGRREVREDWLDAGLVARWRASFDMPGTLPEGAPAPLLIHHCLAHPVAPTHALSRDGHPEKGGFLPPVPLPRRMWAGGDIRFLAPLRVGARIWRHSEIADVRVKTGRSGTLCFVAVDHRIEDERGPVIEERQDIVYRADPSGPTTSAPPLVSPPDKAAHKRTIPLSEPLLFRYSALTFNAHRIHYDLPYAQSAEAYPGLVVHGPLQAALLCQYAADQTGKMPLRFSFRGVAPLVGMAPFQLCAARKDRVMTVWTERAGHASMIAQAHWS